MARPASGKRRLTGRIRLDGGEDIGEQPALSVHVVGEDGEVLASTDVGEDGSFGLNEEALAKARRVVVTARDADPNNREAAVMYRPDALRRALMAGDIAIAAHDWIKFLRVRRCVDATLRRCFPWYFVVDELIAEVRALPRALRPVDVLRYLPVKRCAPVCEGTVQVYRRTCCCPPIVVDLDPPIVVDRPVGPPFDVPELIPRIPVPPHPPGPGPDPAPFALQEAVFTGGALDIAKVATLRKTTPALKLQPEFIFPLCHCGPAVKVAEGFVGEGGNIHICWREPLRLFRKNCHDEYAFVVKQNIAGSTVTIYDGPATGQWFDAGDDDIGLTSYHPKAVGCREEEFPVPVNGAFVVLQDVGSTESHRLRTPLPDGADSVHNPAPDSGLLDLDAGPDYALGGNVYLRYHFSEIVGASMKALGARYYRVQWARANGAGDPVSGWETLPVPAWKTWQVSGTDVFPGEHSLGPNSIGAAHDLFHIPFDTGAPLLGNEEWQDGQFHAYVPTASKVESRYLLRIEVFDGAGNRLEPGSGTFTFRRWDTPTTTLPITFAALTHLIRTENRPVEADIVDVTGPGAGAGDCKFFIGKETDQITIHYRAYHPQAGSPSFMRVYSMTVRRGISGGLATPALTSSTEAGEGGSPATHNVTIDDLLDGEAKCSFAVNLGVEALIHNGSGRLSNLDRHDVAAFAVEVG